MQAIKVNYNENKDETKVVFTAEFQDADYVTKLDLLSDAIDTLTKQYNELLSK